MNSDEECLQDWLCRLIDGFDPDTKSTVDPLNHVDRIHCLLTILACLTQELNGIDGRLIKLNTELHNIQNYLKGRDHE